MNSAIIFAFTAGAVATVNPCGFALLPAWFAKQLAGHEGDSATRRFLRSVASGGAVTLGFVTVFTLAALVLGSGASWLGPVLPFAGMLIGVALVLAGLAWIFDVKLPAFAGAQTCRRANERYGAFGFGLSYGFISLSCSLPVFMAAVGVSFLGDNNMAVVNILAFLAGAGGVLAMVSVVAALAGTGVIETIGSHHRVLRKFAGVLTAAAGVYVVLYWSRSLFGEPAWMRAILETGGIWSANMYLWLSEGASPLVVLIGLGAILAATYVVWARVRARV